MFPSVSTQSSQSEVSQDESNLEKHEDAARNIESVDDKDVKCENEVISIDAQAISFEVQTLSDGEIVKPNNDIPANVFGMDGLLSAIRAAKTDPDLLTLSMGMNLTELGLNLNTPEILHTTFPGPFSDLPCRIQDIDYPVPIEYMVSKCIRNTLPDLMLCRFQDDTIFLLFYGSIGDFMQMKSAAELYRRNWRYHTDKKVWICKIPGLTNYKKISTTVEQGRYYYFDPWTWQRVAGEFQIESSKIEECPSLRPIPR